MDFFQREKRKKKTEAFWFSFVELECVDLVFLVYFQ